MEKVMIYPNIGVGKFIFGKSLENTEHLFSKSRRIVIDKKDENIVKVYDGVFSITFEHNTLVEVSILDDISVYLENSNVFDDAIIPFLKNRYKSIYKYGSLIFDEIGLSLYGYVEKEEQKTITVYQKGYWDSIIKE